MSSNHRNLLSNLSANYKVSHIKRPNASKTHLDRAKSTNAFSRTKSRPKTRQNSTKKTRPQIASRALSQVTTKDQNKPTPKFNTAHKQSPISYKVVSQNESRTTINSKNLHRISVDPNEKLDERISTTEKIIDESLLNNQSMSRDTSKNHNMSRDSTERDFKGQPIVPDYVESQKLLLPKNIEVRTDQKYERSFHSRNRQDEENGEAESHDVESESMFISKMTKMQEKSNNNHVVQSQQIKLDISQMDQGLNKFHNLHIKQPLEEAVEFNKGSHSHKKQKARKTGPFRASKKIEKLLKKEIYLENNQRYPSRTKNLKYIEADSQVIRKPTISLVGSRNHSRSNSEFSQGHQTVFSSAKKSIKPRNIGSRAGSGAKLNKNKSTISVDRKYLSQELDKSVFNEAQKLRKIKDTLSPKKSIPIAARKQKRKSNRLDFIAESKEVSRSRRAKNKSSMRSTDSKNHKNPKFEKNKKDKKDKENKPKITKESQERHSSPTDAKLDIESQLQSLQIALKSETWESRQETIKNKSASKMQKVIVDSNEKKKKSKQLIEEIVNEESESQPKTSKSKISESQPEKSKIKMSQPKTSNSKMSKSKMSKSKVSSSRMSISRQSESRDFLENDFQAQLEDEAGHKTLNTAKLSQPKKSGKRSMRSQEGSRQQEGSRFSQLSRPSDIERESRTFDHDDELHSISKMETDRRFDPVSDIPSIPEELDFFHINFAFIDLANQMFSPTFKVIDNTNKKRVKRSKRDTNNETNEKNETNEDSFYRREGSLPKFYHDRISQQPSFYHNHSPDKNCCDASVVHSHGVDHHRSQSYFKSVERKEIENYNFYSKYSFNNYLKNLKPQCSRNRSRKLNKSNSQSQSQSRFGLHRRNMSTISQNIFAQTNPNSQNLLSLNGTINMHLEADCDDNVPEISEWFKDMPGFQIKSGFEIPKKSPKKKPNNDYNNRSSPNKVNHLPKGFDKLSDKPKVDIVVPFSKTTHSLNVSKDSSENNKEPQVPSKTYKYSRAQVPPKLYPILQKKASGSQFGAPERSESKTQLSSKRSNYTSNSYSKQNFEKINLQEKLNNSSEAKPSNKNQPQSSSTLQPQQSKDSITLQEGNNKTAQNSNSKLPESDNNSQVSEDNKISFNPDSPFRKRVVVKVQDDKEQEEDDKVKDKDSGQKKDGSFISVKKVLEKSTRKEQGRGSFFDASKNIFGKKSTAATPTKDSISINKSLVSDSKKSFYESKPKKI